MWVETMVNQLCFGRRLMSQRGWFIVRVIPFDKLWGAPPHLSPRVKMPQIPKLLTPQSIDSFDRPIAFWLRHGDKNQFDA
jgi:hypothetical protein